MCACHAKNVNDALKHNSLIIYNNAKSFSTIISLGWCSLDKHQASQANQLSKFCT
jgi:hypothetical protein